MIIVALLLHPGFGLTLMLSLQPCRGNYSDIRSHACIHSHPCEFYTGVNFYIAHESKHSSTSHVHDTDNIGACNDVTLF